VLYNVSFLGQENGKTYKFEMSRDVEYINIIIGVDNDVLASIQIDEMRRLLEEYYLDKKCYTDRELTKKILKKGDPPILFRLFRSFAAFYVCLNYCADKNDFQKSDIFVKHINESFERCCYDSSRIESSDIEVSVMYFLKKMDDEYNNDILELYNAGILHKVEVKIKNGELGSELSNYYIPFDTRNNAKFQQFPVMKRISQDMQQELSKFNQYNIVKGNNLNV
jgi:hypothetical protein